MRRQNVIIFSSGESERSGLLAAIRDGVTNANCFCFDWRSLFADANSEERVALLPMLIKKIPSFDFAVLICEGCDSASIERDGKAAEHRIMRDNVLFEIGLCTMALGADRVILLTDKEVRIPDDLVGVSDIGLKQIQIDYSSLQAAVTEITGYIEINKPIISPVVVGAAVSSAEGYMTNFILRCFESIDSGAFDCQSGERLSFDIDKLRFRVILPEHYTENTPRGAFERAKQLGLRRAWVEARSRRVEFNYILSGDTLFICDLPTSLVASYNTAKEILDIDADDKKDVMASDRFTAKELDLFELTLKKLSKRRSLIRRMEHFGISGERAEIIAERLGSSLEIIRENY